MEFPLYLSDKAGFCHKYTCAHLWSKHVLSKHFCTLNTNSLDIWQTDEFSLSNTIVVGCRGDLKFENYKLVTFSNALRRIIWAFV